MKNRRSEFSMPIIATDDRDGGEKRQHDARQLGGQLELSRTCPRIAAAIACVIGRAKTIPTTTSAPVTISSALMTRLPSRHAASRSVAS